MSESPTSMKECKLTVKINRSPEDIFKFVLNPNNTPLWIDSIKKEVTSETPAKVGTVYRNVNGDGVWNKYTITSMEEPGFFVMTAEDNNYNVKYTIKRSGKSQSELEYFEWVNKGYLESPFTQGILEKLAQIMNTPTK